MQSTERGLDRDASALLYFFLLFLESVSTLQEAVRVAPRVYWRMGRMFVDMMM